MNSRALLLFALLAAPAWSQEAPTFDPQSNAVKNIVRATAATQVATPRIEEKKVPEPKPAFHYEPPEKVARMERPAPRIPPMPKTDDTFFDSLVQVGVGTVLDNVLGKDWAQDVNWNTCSSVDSRAAPLQREVTPECLQVSTNLP